MSLPRLFHLLHAADWEAARTAGRHAPPSLGAEGFCHLSLAHQLAGTLAAHFDPAAPPWLVEVELADAGDLRLEPSRGGADFPHLYRALDLAELARRWPLDPRNENWGLPNLGSAPAQDDPPGLPLPAR